MEFCARWLASFTFSLFILCWFSLGGLTAAFEKQTHTTCFLCFVFHPTKKWASLPELSFSLPHYAFFFFLLAIISQLIPFSLNSVLDFISYISPLFRSVSFYWIIIINGFEDTWGPLSGSDIQIFRLAWKAIRCPTLEAPFLTLTTIK